MAQNVTELRLEDYLKSNHI